MMLIQTPSNLLRLGVAERFRECDVVLVTDVLIAIIIQALDQRRRIPVVMR